MRTRYRVKDPGAAHFVTSTIVEWLPVFTSTACCDILVNALEYGRQIKALKIYAWVIMDTHFHAILAAGAAILNADDVPRTVESLRAMPPPALAAGMDVQVSGVVTYLRDTPEDFNFILDDGTGGVMVYPRKRAPLQLGQRAAVHGVTRLDRPFLRIEAASLTPGEHTALPAPVRATLADLRMGAFEGRYVQMEETVRVVRLESAELKPRRLALDFGPRGSRLTAWMSHYEGAEHRFAPGARVRVAGVCVLWRNDRAQPVGASLLINSPADVIDLPAATPPPPESLRDLLLWTGADDMGALRETSGFVTYCEPGELVVIQDGDRAIRVRPAPADALNMGPPTAILTEGTRVEVTGYPALGEYTAEMEDARLSVVGRGKSPRAEPISDATALLAIPGLVDRDARLVSLPATVREIRSRDARQAIDLTSGGHVFAALLPAGEALPARVRPGADVRVTGICTLHLNAERRRLGRHPGDFSLLLRAPADFEVLRAAPWWTAGRLWAALAAVAAAAALIAGWAVWLGRKNARLSTEISARRRAEHLLAGERRRMAADLHDTLDQTLLAAGLQLGAASRTVVTAPAAASTQIALAHQLLARGQQEVRDAVWDLHAGDAEPQSLEALLARVCSEAASHGGGEVVFSAQGEPLPLPPFMAAQCVRLAREALANATKHGKPSGIVATLTFSPATLRLSIVDDGCGFETGSAPGPETGHFGLTGMRERLQRLGGALEIQSSPGAGATVTAVIPLPPP